MKNKTLSTLRIFILFLLITLISACAAHRPNTAPKPEAAAAHQNTPTAQPKASEDTAVIPAIVATTGWPAAFVPEPEHNFGTVVDGTKVVHSFVIENQGEAPLRITEITTGCACAVPEYPKMILPGDKGEVVITIDTNGYGGREFIREIMISTNEPNNSVQKCVIFGNISLFADITPKSLILKGTAGEPVQTASTITPLKEYPFTITGFELDDNLKETVSVDIAQDGGKFIVTAKNKMKTAGQYLGKMVIKTDSPVKPEIKIFVRGIIR